jgi:hypothetical protein
MAVVLATMVLASGAGVALAQVPNPPPDASIPGGGLITQVLGWLKYGGLASAVAGLLIGSVTLSIGHFGSNYPASAAGRKWLLGGIGGAMLAGLAWTIATTVFKSAG